MHPMCQHSCRNRCPYQCTSRNKQQCATRNTPQCPRLVATILVHGGAGSVADEYIPAIKEGIKLAARIGYMTLRSTGSVVDAVQEAVGVMEMNPNFNAGYGSALAWNGKVEMDAAIMNGETLNAGCVSIARNVLHPVALARRVMEKTRHKYLAGDGLTAFAEEELFDILPEDSLVTPKSLKALEDYKASLNFSVQPIFDRPSTISKPPVLNTPEIASVSKKNSLDSKMLTNSSAESSGESTLITHNLTHNLMPRSSTSMPKKNDSVQQSKTSVPPQAAILPQSTPSSRRNSVTLQKDTSVPLPPIPIPTSASQPPPSPMLGSTTTTGIPITSTEHQSEADQNATKKQRRPKKLEKEYGSPGTVGAVAIDEFGNVAAATSTGGITGKMPGRIGDSSILGGGTYADNETGAISATGQGETIMRYNVASRILALIKYAGMGAHQATSTVLDEMFCRFNQTAGVITIDRDGQLGIYFTSHRMSWAYQRGRELHYGIEKGDDIMEIVGQPRIEDFECLDN